MEKINEVIEFVARRVMYRYHDWETLINDELKYLPADHPFIAKLIEAKNEYRNIPQKPSKQIKIDFDYAD
jgi:hypothetical protein